VYWRKRDVESVPLYFQALSMGRLSYVNCLNELIMDRLNAAGTCEQDRMRDVFERRRSPFDGVAPSNLLRWFGAELLRGKHELLLPFLSSIRFGAMVQRELAERTRLLERAEARLRRSQRRASGVSSSPAPRPVRSA
jgi:hypothetical protein